LAGAPRRSKHHLLVVLGLTLALAFGCAAPATRPLVTSITLHEQNDAHVVDDSAVLDGLATSEEYDPNLLSRDLERVERFYRARGYYEAKVTAARVLEPDARHVRIELRVTPGEPVILRSVEPHGIADLPSDLTGEVVTALGHLKVGKLFDEASLDETKSEIEDALQNGGFPYAKVDAKAHVDLTKHSADVTVSITPGIAGTFGEVRIIGLNKIPEKPVRDNLRIVQGRRYSRTRLSDAQRTVLDLGVFSSVEIHQDLTHPEQSAVPIQVVVREGQLRTIRLGGGAGFDVLSLNAHLRMGWEHLNFLGGTRYFSINALPGVALFPTRLDGNTPVAPTRVLLQNSLQASFRQPSFIEGRTTGTIDARYDVKPFLYPLPAGTNPNTERIIGLQTVSTKFGVERKFRLHPVRGRPVTLTVSPSYNWQANFPFTYQNEPPGGLQASGLENVRVSFPALLTILDFRDDPVEPRSWGVYLQNTVEAAGGIFGGTVSDVKVQPELRAYAPISVRHKVTLATRVTLGFLFPRNYGDTLNPRTAEGQASALDPLAPSVVSDQERLLLRAFYSGGPNSNRGYPLRGVGPHGPVGFLIPTGADCSLERDGMPISVAALNSACIRPLGGFTLWEGSLELRFPISGAISGIAFADASDVTRDVGHVRFTVPHLSVGPGLRYMTPVGPLRLDLGYRVPGAQAFGDTQLAVSEGRETGTLFGVKWLPVAINLAIGEAF